MQGVNDVILFSVAGMGSMASGYLFAELGWKMLLLAIVGMVRMRRITTSDCIL